MHREPYLAPILTVDSVVFQLINERLEVLLIQRAKKPFEGQWALPGGYNAAGETTRQAMQRVLLRKCGVATHDIDLIEQLYTFDTVARDPRGHAVSVTYMGLGKDFAITPSDTTQNPQTFPITDLPALAYDHAHIITYAHDRLKSKLSYTNIMFALMPAAFTLSQLQVGYEAVLCTQLDKRNFRKKILSLGIIEETGELETRGAHRPARLYRFIKNELQVIDNVLD